MARNWDGMMAVVQKALQLNIIERYHSDVGHDAGLLLGDDAPQCFAWVIHPRGCNVARLEKWDDLKFLLCLGDSHKNLADAKWFLFRHMELVEYSYTDVVIESAKLLGRIADGKDPRFYD